ncbi:MAG: alkaline phosphatase [Acidobacteriota bacterium]
MMKRLTLSSLVIGIVVLATFLASACSSQTTEPAAAPRNVILLIGDGLDDHQLTLARNYLQGPDGAFVMEGLPVTGASKVLTVAEDDPSRPVYVADSANSATAMATGEITSIGRIATTAGTDRDLVTILELARDAGYRTGLVTTASIADATPAAFATHIRNRHCMGPRDMLNPLGIFGPEKGCQEELKSNGGLGSIAEQLIASETTVLLGGGISSFEQPLPEDSAQTVLDLARAAGYRVITQPDDLTAAEPGTMLLGLFASGTMAVEWQGEDQRRAEFMAFDSVGEPISPVPFACVPNPRHAGLPSLAEMTAVALKSLSEDNQRGFFLMVEGASIDKQAHVRNPCGQIGETAAFDQAVAGAIAFARQQPDTLLIVTADHGQTGQIVSYPSLAKDRAQARGLGPQYTLGRLALLTMPHGGVMAVQYATNSSPDGIFEEHTGTHVPVFASGPGADPLNGLIRQSDIFAAMARHLGVPH